jgi:mono/diheme cytochrome c family protein
LYAEKPAQQNSHYSCLKNASHRKCAVQKIFLKLYVNSGVLIRNVQGTYTIMMKITALVLFGFATVALADDAKLPPASTKTDVTFDKDIKPIFDASCVKCHGGEKAKAGLHLNTLDGALKGGKNGKDKVVVVGDSAKSDLVKMVAHVGDPDGWMPPTKNKAGIGPLTDEQVGLIRAWIDQGAK